MNPLIAQILDGFEIGDVLTYGPIRVVPIIGGPEPRADYLPLSRALDREGFSVTEVSGAGSVPDLLVTNDLDETVLLLDGEELAGAKQNRVLNTTILVPARSTLTVPVSCTEQGRWAYRSRKFEHSGHLAARLVRTRASASTYRSLHARMGYRSDQGAVWSSVADVLGVSGTRSRTSAMHDAFKDWEKRLDEAVEALPWSKGQRGSVFLNNDEVVGLDVLSRPGAYRSLHEKLVRSYTLGVDLSTAEFEGDAEQLVYAFLARVRAVEKVDPFESVGLGTSYQLMGADVMGSILVHEDESIHVTCFPFDREQYESEAAFFEERLRGFVTGSESDEVSDDRPSGSDEVPDAENGGEPSGRGFWRRLFDQ